MIVAESPRENVFQKFYDKKLSLVLRFTFPSKDMQSRYLDFDEACIPMHLSFSSVANFIYQNGSTVRSSVFILSCVSHLISTIFYAVFYSWHLASFVQFFGRLRKIEVERQDDDSIQVFAYSSITVHLETKDTMLGKESNLLMSD